MTEFTVKAEFDVLDSARVHAPGFETFAGIVDPKPNLFRSDFSIEDGKTEHSQMVKILEAEGVNVHYLHEDLNAGARLNDLLADIEVQIKNATGSQKDLEADLRAGLEQLAPREKLQLVACNATIMRHQNDTNADETEHLGFGNERLDRSSIAIEEPLSNLYFQRDQQLVTARGPVMGAPAFATRAGEIPICRAAWESVGASIVEDVPRELNVEGGDYIPAGDFALLGVSATVKDEQKRIRTSRAAARYLLEHDAFGHDEVALVEAPYQADREQQRRRGSNKEPAMEVMHLDTWFNIPMEGVAVARKPLVEGTSVQVYHRDESGYEHSYTENFATYLEEKDYNVVPVKFEERATATNFLTLDDGVVLAPRYANGENETLKRMRQAGVEIVPDGEGIPIDELRSGYGGIHCMVTPLNRC